MEKEYVLPAETAKENPRASYSSRLRGLWPSGRDRKC